MKVDKRWEERAYRRLIHMPVSRMGSVKLHSLQLLDPIRCAMNMMPWSVFRRKPKGVYTRPSLGWWQLISHSHAFRQLELECVQIKIGLKFIEFQSYFQRWWVMRSIPTCGNPCTNTKLSSIQVASVSPPRGNQARLRKLILNFRTSWLRAFRSISCPLKPLLLSFFLLRLDW